MATRFAHLRISAPNPPRADGNATVAAPSSSPSPYLEWSTPTSTSATPASPTAKRSEVSCRQVAVMSSFRSRIKAGAISDQEPSGGLDFWFLTGLERNGTVAAIGLYPLYLTIVALSAAYGTLKDVRVMEIESYHPAEWTGANV